MIPEPGAGVSAGAGPGDKSGTLTWDYDIPLVNNIFMLRDFFMVLVLSLVGMQLCVLLVGFLAGEGAVIFPAKVYGIVAGVFVVLFLIAAGLVLLNRSRTRFTVGPEGVGYEPGPRERRTNRAVFWLSVLVGRPGPALIAASQATGEFEWADIHKVTVHGRQSVITLSNSWRPILRLYCPPETFGPVLALVQHYASAAAAKRAARPREVSRRRPWWAYVAWTVGVAAATFLGMADYDIQLDDMWRWLLLEAVLVLVSGLVEEPLSRRLLSLAGFVVGIFVLIYLLRDAFRPIVGLGGTYYGRAYEIDTWLFVVALAGQLALLAMAGWRLFGKSRGTVTRGGRAAKS